MILLKKLHNGLRKDGEHEFHIKFHKPVSLERDVMYKEELFMVIFFYMMCVRIRAFPMKKLKVIWRLVMNSVKLMTKVYQGVKTQIMSIMLR
jgi:hypothetical protein